MLEKISVRNFPWGLLAKGSGVGAVIGTLITTTSTAISTDPNAHFFTMHNCTILSISTGVGFAVSSLFAAGAMFWRFHNDQNPDEPESNPFLDSYNHFIDGLSFISEICKGPRFDRFKAKSNLPGFGPCVVSVGSSESSESSKSSETGENKGLLSKQSRSHRYGGVDRADGYDRASSTPPAVALAQPAGAGPRVLTPPPILSDGVNSVPGRSWPSEAQVVTRVTRVASLSSPASGVAVHVGRR